MQCPGFPIRFRSMAIAAIASLVTALCTASTPAGAAVTIHPPDAVLDTWCFESGGRLFMRSPEGDLWEFVTEVDDPEIKNRGAGSFFPVAAGAVEEAIRAVRYPVSNLDIEIFLLPFPRRGLLPSSAGHRAIYLSPGVHELSATQTHSLVAHELGHVLHNHLLPDTDDAGWDRYRTLRGIQDEGVYHAHAAHANRPHEIFAEDFRFLFGGAQANYSGSIENHDLPLPSQVPGLADFFRSLSGVAGIVHDVPTRGRLHVFPNPARDQVRVEFAENVSFRHGDPLTLKVFDLNGRILRTETVTAGNAISWGGRTDHGSPAPPGVYFLEVESSRDRWVGKVLLSR